MAESISAILEGSCLDVLPTLPDKSAHCCVTSPPYWGLRDYGTDRQLGLEPTPAEYVAKMVEVFREVRRVLRDDGTVWLNLGDSFANKQLQGIPWRVAFALQDDGWYLRSDIIWSKPNPMPESVTDRPTKAHEYIFLLAKNARYFYDADAVREAGVYTGLGERVVYDGKWSNASMQTAFKVMNGRRNARSVWTITTQPYPEAHFATFPEAIPERCIKAGTSERGCCPECGASWERVVDKLRTPTGCKTRGAVGCTDRNDATYPRMETTTTTTGWNPSCGCNAGDPQPCTVLDPFTGSGTTGAVARKLGRSFIGIELNPEYIKLAENRIGKAANPNTYRSDKTGDAPLFNGQESKLIL